MSYPRSDTARPLPRWLVAAGSALVLAHLSAVAALALAAPSGPWPTAFGGSTAAGPQFALALSEPATRYYLTPIKMDANYHFPGNRPAAPGVSLEVRLKDAGGRTIRTIRLPDDRANFWARHRQTLLVQALADDQPVQARPGEVVAAPNQQVQTIDIWDFAPDRTLRLRAVPEHLVPRDRPVFRPSEWSLVLARSYARHLCRVHGAAAAELVRHTREPVLPAVVFLPELPPGAFDDLVSNFGELPR